MSDLALNAAVKEAAHAVEAKFPGAHVLCLALAPGGEVGVFAKSDDICDVPQLLRALRWFSGAIRRAGKVIE
jgi:hypothetical protein